MKYDDASWHYGGDFPKESPDEYGATHIALFLKWCFSKGWVGELHTDDEPEDVNKVVEGTLAATEFFMKYCDGKLTDEDFNSEGNAFAEKYYGDDGLYLDDYAEHIGDHMYMASESDHDYRKLASIIEARYKSGVLTKNDL